MAHFPHRAGNYILFAELGAGTFGSSYIGRAVGSARGMFKPLALRILDPRCVAKTFPDYFEALFGVATASPLGVPVITIDGPTASGKGTLAAAVAVVVFGVTRWKEIARNTDWGVLLLFGGGLFKPCLAEYVHGARHGGVAAVLRNARHQRHGHHQPQKRKPELARNANVVELHILLPLNG